MVSFKQFYSEAYQEIRPGVVQWVDDETEERPLVTHVAIERDIQGNVERVIPLNDNSLRGACVQIERYVRRKYADEIKHSDMPRFYGKISIVEDFVIEDYDVAGKTYRVGFVGTGPEGSISVIEADTPWGKMLLKFNKWDSEDREIFDRTGL